MNRKHKYHLYPTSDQESTRFGYYRNEIVVEQDIVVELETVERLLPNGATIRDVVRRERPRERYVTRKVYVPG